MHRAPRPPTIQFQYSPPELFRHLKGRELRRLVLIDVQPDISSTNCRGSSTVLEINLNVVFNDVQFRCVKKTFHYAAPGGTIVVDIEEGNILDDYTSESSLGVNYTNSEQHQQAWEVSFIPTATVKAGAASATLKGPGAKISAGSERTFESQFSGKERVLSSQSLLPSQLEWQIRPTRGMKVVSDFVYGNLCLYFLAACETELTGCLRVIPDRVAWYDPQRREISGLWKRIGMSTLASKFCRSVKNRNGLDLKFTMSVK